MKVLKWTNLFIMTFVFLTFVQASGIEYQKAMDRLNQGKEVYLSFYRNLAIPLDDIGKTVFLDKINNDLVYAYVARKDQFEKFTQLDLLYQVEVNPSEQFKVECSDYKNWRTTDKIDKYPTYDGYQTLLKQFETDYPDFCTVFDFGETVKKRKVLGLKITAKNNIPKPRVLWLGAIHGDELTGTVCSFRMFKLLMEKYETDPRIKRIVDSTEIWTIPFENLDGTYARGNNTVNGAKRSNANGYDLNRSSDCPPGTQKEGKEQVETRNKYRLLKQKRFTIGCDSHGGIECFIHPWACKRDNHPQRALYRTVGEFLRSKVVNGSGMGLGNAMETVKYLARGTQSDYLDYYGEMMGWCFEMSSRKLIQESQFDTYWNKFREMMLCFYELALTGIQGVITDSETGKGIDSVVVTVEGESQGFLKRTSYNGGFYCRIIKEGTYNLTFKHKDYQTQTINGVKAVDLKKTALNVEMVPINTGVAHGNNIIPGMKVLKQDGKITVTWDTNYKNVSADIYSLNGTLIHHVKTHTSGMKSISWEGSSNIQQGANGCYFVNLIADGKQFVQKVMVMK